VGTYKNIGSARRTVMVGNGVTSIAPGGVAELPDVAARGIRALVRVDEPVADVAEVAQVEEVTLPLTVDAAPAAPPVAAMSRKERKRLAREAE